MFSPPEQEWFLKELKESAPTFDERIVKVLDECTDDENDIGRTTRSGLEFLWEDVIQNQEELHDPWRIFMNGEAVEELNRMLTLLCNLRTEYSFPGIVENIVSISHNWWRPINRSYTWEWFNIKRNWLLLDDWDHNPLLPSLAVEEKRWRLQLSFENIADVEDVLTKYFDYSTACRLHRLHPLTLLSFPKEKMIALISFIDSEESFKNENISVCIENIQKIRSAIEFLEEEFVPHCEEIQEPWKLFREGEAIKELEKVLKNPAAMKASGKAMDLRMVGENHWWMTKEDREKSEKMYGTIPARALAPFTLHSIEVEKKRVICSMLKMWIYNESTLGTDFLWNYFRFSKRIRSLSKNPRDFLTKSDQKELKWTLSSATEKMNSSMISLCDHRELEKNLWRLRGCRSAIEFVGEDIVDEEIKANWNAFLSSTGIQKINQRLQEFKARGSGQYVDRWGDEQPFDLRGIAQPVHDWWPEEEIRSSDESYGKRGWKE